MIETLAWDCGTQVDLADIDGLLYVPGTHTIRPRLKRLAEQARQRGIPRLCTVITHRAGDPDLAAGKPDYKTTWPAHCIEGSAGWKQIPETACQRAIEIPREPHAERPVRESLRAAHSEILLECAGFDPWSNVALGTLFEVLEPRRVVVFGVPADRMVAAAVEGVLTRGLGVAVVHDAVKPFDVKLWDPLRAAWTEKGVVFVDHASALASQARS